MGPRGGCSQSEFACCQKELRRDVKGDSAGGMARADSVRGNDIGAECLFSLVSCEAPALADHPRRPICAAVNEALSALSGDFNRLYARPSRSSNFASEPMVPTSPDKLLRTLLLQAFYPVRSERQLMELDYNLFFRWFVGLPTDAPVTAGDHDRLLAIIGDRNASQKHVWRARIVLLTAGGHGTTKNPETIIAAVRRGHQTLDSLH
jgi:Transposase domain (DUF772)